MSSIGNFSVTYRRACEGAMLALRTRQTRPSPEPNTPIPVSGSPLRAKFVRGAWTYEHLVSTPRGPSPRWQPAPYFESTSVDDLARLRSEYLDTLPAARRTIAEAAGA